MQKKQIDESKPTVPNTKDLWFRHVKQRKYLSNASKFISKNNGDQRVNKTKLSRAFNSQSSINKEGEQEEQEHVNKSNDESLDQIK